MFKIESDIKISSKRKRNKIIPPPFDNKGLPITRKEAEEKGFNLYITGFPCKRGHISERYTKGGACAECVAFTRSNHPDKRRRSAANIVHAKQAEIAGKTTFIPDKPCKHGHMLRFTISNNCVECDEITRKKHKISQKYCRIKKVYKLQKEEYLKLVSDQNSSCKICGKYVENHFRLHIDHCHDTNKVRALLCGTCNQGIGLLKHSADLLLKAAEYCT